MILFLSCALNSIECIVLEKLREANSNELDIKKEKKETPRFCVSDSSPCFVHSPS